MIKTRYPAVLTGSLCLDSGYAVQSFVFEVDCRIGDGTANPADGFSLNFARTGDNTLADGAGFNGGAAEEGTPGFPTATENGFLPRRKAERRRILESVTFCPDRDPDGTDSRAESASLRLSAPVSP